MPLLGVSGDEPALGWVASKGLVGLSASMLVAFSVGFLGVWFSFAVTKDAAGGLFIGLSEGFVGLKLLRGLVGAVTKDELLGFWLEWLGLSLSLNVGRRFTGV